MNLQDHIPPFYLGQEIIAIATHENNNYKRNETFIVRQIKYCSCGCKNWVIDIGIVTEFKHMQCCISDRVYENDNFYLAINFRPIQKMRFTPISYKKVIAIESELISIN